MRCRHLSVEGKTPTEITFDSDTLTIVCGEDAFRAYHMQECCEHVAIHDISGDLQQLVGKTITEATQEDVSDRWPGDVPCPGPLYMPESYTWTTQVFCAEGVRVVVRWLGQSNGYYGEDVYFERTHVPIELADGSESP